jgi:hypothetical protein
MVELFGYLATFFLALSLLVNRALQFRWFNLFGQISFIVYGIILEAFPIIIANGILLCINCYRLIQLYRSSESFQLIPVKTYDEWVKKFLDFNKNDIENYFPDYTFSLNDDKICFMVLRDLTLANIFVATLDGKGNAFVEINYTIPQYRDYKVGKFIFEKETNYLKEKGVQRVVYRSVYNSSHKQFLKKLSFKSQPQSNIAYCKDIE